MDATTNDNGTGVSWGAIFAGAVCAAALFLTLLLLGFGLGISSFVFWVDTEPSMTVVGVSTIAWLTFAQIAASGLGGYLAGRLRVKWTAVNIDEVFFRDTAHGLITWAVATLDCCAAGWAGARVGC